jgi:hypothetical protein
MPTHNVPYVPKVCSPPNPIWPGQATEGEPTPPQADQASQPPSVPTDEK